MREVVEIAPLVTLQQCTQLGRQHLFAGKCGNGRLAREPGIIDLQRQRRRAVESLGLAGVDLDLQPDRHATAVFGIDPEAKLRCDRTLIEPRAPQPRFQNDTQSIEDGTDRPAGSPDQVDVLGIAHRPREVQLVERRPATNPYCGVQHVVGEYLHQSTADDEVLFDLSLIGPGNDVAPGDDILRRDHASA